MSKQCLCIQDQPEMEARELSEHTLSSSWGQGHTGTFGPVPAEFQ